LRRALTPAEFVLWTRLRGRQLGGFKFVRQEPIDRYYVDFVLPRAAFDYRARRRATLGTPRRRATRYRASALGYRVIRIWNNDVIENLDGVLETLLSELEKSPLTPALSPQAGRGR